MSLGAWAQLALGCVQLAVYLLQTLHDRGLISDAEAKTILAVGDDMRTRVAAAVAARAAADGAPAGRLRDDDGHRRD